MKNLFSKSVFGRKGMVVGALFASSFLITAVAYACSVNVIVNTVGGSQTSSDFTVNVAGDNNPQPSLFPGSATGTEVTFSGAGNFQVAEASSSNYATSYAGNCSGHINGTDRLTCIVTNIANATNPTSTPTSTVSASVGISKTVDDGNPAEGETIHYTVTVSALGPDASDAVVATDTIPSGLTFETDTTSLGVYDPNTGTWTVGDMSASTTATLVITATVNQGTAGTAITNTAKVSESVSNGNSSANSTASASVTINVKQGGGGTPTSTTPCTLSAGDFETAWTNGSVSADYIHVNSSTATFTLVNNTGCGAPVSLTAYQMFVQVGAPQWLSSQQLFSIASTTVAANSSTTLTVQLPSCRAQLDAWYGEGPANLLDSNPYSYPYVPFVLKSTFAGTDLCGSGTPTSTIAGLTITKTADVTSTVEGGTIHYTLTVNALGPASSTDVVATDTLPSGLTFVTDTTSLGSYDPTTGTWTIGNMCSCGTATLTITATVNPGTAGTTITNTAIVGESASSTNPDSGNASSSVSITIQPSGCTSNCGGGGGNPTSTPTSTIADLSIMKTVDNTNPSVGDTVHYTVTVTDLGPDDAPMVVANDILPSQVSFNSVTSSQGTYNSGSGQWFIGTLTANATATLDIAATVNAGAGTAVVNTANVSSTLGSLVDNSQSNNSSSVTINVQSGGGGCTSNCGGGGGNPTSTPTSTIAGLTIAKIADVTSTDEGGTINYTLTVSALGPATSTDVVATDTLPTGLTFVNATASQGTYASSTGTWMIGILPASSTATLSIQATVNAGTAGTTITNGTVVGESASSTNPNGGNASSSVPVVINPPSGCTSNCGGGGGGGGGGVVVTSGGGGTAYFIAINDGASSTATTSVTLSLYGTGAYTMEISNTSDFASSTWIPYATVMPWVLTPGAGEKTVYAKFRSVQGSDLATVSASIELLGGQVLGTSTSCGIYLNSYIHIGWNNDPNEVKKLQIFLNENLGTDLPVTGTYTETDLDAVNRFQVKYGTNVLAPWIPYGLPNAQTPTGFVYKTTRWWINELVCSSLNLPVPQLP